MLSKNAIAGVAALGAGVALAQRYPALATEANGIDAVLGFVNGTGNVTVTVNNPTTSGSNTGNSSAVEVMIVRPQRWRRGLPRAAGSA
jgi:hypothetical protein